MDVTRIGVVGAGTMGRGIAQVCAASGIYNEFQAGSYVFMDADYAKNLDETGGPFTAFEHSLFVYSTVMSRPARFSMWRSTPSKPRSGPCLIAS